MVHSVYMVSCIFVTCNGLHCCNVTLLHGLHSCSDSPDGWWLVVTSRTREDAREYMRAYRARKRASKPGAPAVSIPASVPVVFPAPRPVEVVDQPSGGAHQFSVLDYVLRELESIPEGRRRPADVAIALAMSRILDDVSSTPQQPQAAARMAEAMVRMRGGGDEVKGKLQTLRDLREIRNAG